MEKSLGIVALIIEDIAFYSFGGEISGTAAKRESGAIRGKGFIQMWDCLAA